MQSSASRLLVVDDDSITLGTFARLLRYEGYHVRTASGVHEALEVANEHAVDVVLCDIGLPDGSGLDLMRSLSKIYNLCGIAISGYGEVTDVEDCRRAGFVTHLLKPVTLETVRAAIEVCEASIRKV
jgi:two-component system CheB/CheR fusion protein